MRASALCLHDNSMRDIRVMCMKNILYSHETKKIRQTEASEKAVKGLCNKDNRGSVKYVKVCRIF